MIERKIRVGMVLDFPLPNFANYQDSETFLQPVPTIYCHIWRHGGDKNRTRGLGDGYLDDRLLRRQAHRFSG